MRRWLRRFRKDREPDDQIAIGGTSTDPEFVRLREEVDRLEAERLERENR